MNRLALGFLVGLGLVLYLRSPIDLIPDRAGAVGLLDDLVALLLGGGWMWKRLPRPQGQRAGASGAGAGASQSRGGDATEERTGRFDPYEVLGIERGASQDDIRRAYHEQLRRYHPDRVDGLGDELQRVAHARTLDIRRAYDALKRR